MPTAHARSEQILLKPVPAAALCRPVALIEGLPISLAPHAEVLSEVDRVIEIREIGHYISITNTESMYHGLRIPAHGQYIRNSDFSLCDGVGVIVAGWAWGHRIRRFNGPILQLKCCSYGVTKGWRHFFYGGKEGVAKEMVRRLKAMFPSLVVCGIYEPPFRELTSAEEEAMIQQINASRPDIVWVGLGLIKQERWIAKYLGHIEASWMVGVGAAFDYHAGVVPWAPPMLRTLGMEWIFRLIIQPRLRAKRYWWSAVYVVQSFARGLATVQLLRRRKHF